jgi:hypothetical protein
MTTFFNIIQSIDHLTNDNEMGYTIPTHLIVTYIQIFISDTSELRNYYDFLQYIGKIMLFIYSLLVSFTDLSVATYVQQMTI